MEKPRTAARCASCNYPIAEHIGHKPCVEGTRSGRKSLYDLPIFGWAWREER